MKITSLLKRIGLISFFVCFAFFLLYVLILNSPLVAMGLESLLEDVTGQKVAIGSARLRLFPQVRLALKELSLKEHGANEPFFTVDQLIAEGDTLKLLEKEIDITQLEVNGFKLLLISDPDTDYNLLPPSFLAKFSSDKSGEGIKDPSKWKFIALSLVIKKGWISYSRGETKENEQAAAAENVHGSLIITAKDLGISSLAFSYQDAVTTIAGSIRDYRTEDPSPNLQVKGDFPFSLLKKYMPEQASTLAGEKTCRVALTLRGPLSQLLLNARLNILPAGESLSGSFTPTDISLKAQLKNKEHLQLDYLKVNSPAGNISGEGTIGSILSAERKFGIKYTAHAVLNDLTQHLTKDSTIKGAVSCKGTLEGGVDSFDATAAVDLSSLSVDLPGRVAIAENDLRSVTVTCSKRGDTIELVSKISQCFRSAGTLKAAINDIFSDKKSFKADLQGRLFLPALVKSFPGSIPDDFTVRGETPVHIAFKGSAKNKQDVHIQDLSIRLQKSHVTLSGRVLAHALETPELQVETRGLLEAGEILAFLPELVPEGFSIEGPVAINSTFKGSLTRSFTIDADLDLTESVWEEPYLITKKRGLKNRVILRMSKDRSTESLRGTGTIALESATMGYQFSSPSKKTKQWLVKLKTSPIELSELESLKLRQAGKEYKGKVTLDLNTLINVSHMRESSVTGTVNLDDITLSINDQDLSADAQLTGRGNTLEIPFLRASYGDSDWDLRRALFSWDDVPQLAGTVSSQSLYLKDVLPVAQEAPLEEEHPEKNGHEPSGNVLWKLLESRPRLKVDYTLNNFYMGNQHFQNLHLTLDADEGMYTISSKVPTKEGESTLQAEIVAPFQNHSVKERFTFKISDFNMTELARILEWEEPRLTGMITTNGEVNHVSNPREKWINPQSLNGRVDIKFRQGEIKEMGIIADILNLLNYTTSAVELFRLLLPSMRDLFIADNAYNYLKMRHYSVMIKKIPYDLIGGNFSIMNGFLKTEDLMLTGKVIDLAAAFSMDMPRNNTLKGDVAARPFRSAVPHIVREIPFMGKALMWLQDKLIATYLTVNGTLAEPKIQSANYAKMKQGTKNTFSYLGDRIHIGD